MILTKTIYFDAAHRLINYIGKCKELHGHTWKVKINIYMSKYLKDLSDTFNGILLDFSDISKIKNIFDHKCLNDVITINPTAENLASIICLMVIDKMYHRLNDIIDDKDNTYDYFNVCVKLWESKTSHVQVNGTDSRNWLGYKPYKTFLRGD